MSPWVAVFLLSSDFIAARAAESGSMPLSDAAVNTPTVIANHFRLKGADGILRLRVGRGKPALSASLEEVEEATVHRVGKGRFSALARLRASGKKSPIWAECVVNIDDALSGVESVVVLDAAKAAAFREKAAAVAIRQLEEEKRGAGAAPEPGVKSSSKGDLRGGSGFLLETSEGKPADPMACADKKCLLAIVAPWCSVCRANTGKILELRDYLEEQGVPTRIVVGKADLEECEEYAADFGPDTMLDPDGAMHAAAYPQFVVLGRGGLSQGVFKGMPKSDSPAELAAAFSLP